MKNKFELLIETAEQNLFEHSCSVGNWNFEPSTPGSFTVSHNGEAVVVCENNQIVDAKWGSRIEDIEVRDILKSLINHIPGTHLDAISVRTDDCLSVLGYEDLSVPISDVPGLEDIDYYRAWVTNRDNPTNPQKTDYVVYWDQGNTWCEVLAVIENVTHEEFVEAIHNKYREWLREEDALSSGLPDCALHEGYQPEVPPEQIGLDARISGAMKIFEGQGSAKDTPIGNFEK